MADDLFTIQGRIEADTSGLSEALTSAQAQVQQTTSTIGESFASVQEHTQLATQPMHDLANATGAVSEQAEHAEGPLGGLSEIFSDMGEHAEKLAGALGLGLGLEELARHALEAAAAVQKAEISITALTGSSEMAEQAIDGLKEMALRLPVAFESLVQVDQKMTALQFSAEQIPQALEAIADAAAATGADFDSTASAFERIALSGMVMPRTLATLGVSLDDVSRAMGVTRDQAREAFQALDQSERVNVLIEALHKFGGVAESEARGAAGQFQILKNEINFAAEEIGKSLTPIAEGIMATMSGLLAVLMPVIEDFAKLGSMQLTDLVTSVKILYSTVSDLLGPLAELEQALKNLDLSQFVSDVINNVTHLRDMRDMIVNIAAAVDVWRGKFPSMEAALQSYSAKIQETHQNTINLGTATDHSVNQVVQGMVKIKETAENDIYPIPDQLTGAVAKIISEQAHATNEFSLALAAFQNLLAGPYSVLEVARAYSELEKAGKAAGLTQEEVNGAIGQFPLVSQPAIQALLDFAGDMREAGNTSKEFMALGNNIADPYVAAMQKIQDEVQQLIFKYDAAIMTYQTMVDAGASAEEIAAALKQVDNAGREAGKTIEQVNLDLLNEAQIAAGLPPITMEQYDAMTKLDGVYQVATHHGLDMAQQIGRSIERDLSRALGDVIFQTGNIADAFKKLGRDVVDIVLNQIIKMALDPLMDKLSSILGSIFGATGSAASAAGSAASSAGGAAGSTAGGVGGAVSGALGSVLGFANLGVSIVSGIVQGFQMAHQETSLNAIELNTRKTSMFIGGLTDGGVQTWTRMTQDNTFNLLQAFNGWFHDAFASLMDSISRIATTPASGGTLHPLAVAPTVNVNVMTTGGNARDVAREIVREIPTYLKSVSPKFSQ